MTSAIPTASNATTLPSSWWPGCTLDGTSDWTGITLAVELPYWLMVPNRELEIYLRGHVYPTAIRDDYAELHLNPADDSKANCVYIGPVNLPSDVAAGLQAHRQRMVWRKCKTVLLIGTRCNADVLAAHREQTNRQNDAHSYLQSLCDAHIELLNTLVQHYRLATYDPFVHELSPWDIPIWFLIPENDDSIRIPLLDYTDLDVKPIIMNFKDRDNPRAPKMTVKYIDSNGLQQALSLAPTDGEYELLDAANLMIRGDYSSAVRRIATAHEAVLEKVLRAELLMHYPPAEVDQKLMASQNNFPGRLQQYQKLSGRVITTSLKAELDRTRDLRHQIVHRGRRLLFQERGAAQRTVDTGRWIFNWLENNPDRRTIRETKLALKSLGKHRDILDSSLTADGVIVSVKNWPIEPSHDEIALSAYFLWESNGRQPDDQLACWFAARNTRGPYVGTTTNANNLLLSRLRSQKTVLLSIRSFPLNTEPPRRNWISAAAFDRSLNSRDPPPLKLPKPPSPPKKVLRK
jgi:Protein of unknown function (DUF2934)